MSMKGKCRRCKKPGEVYNPAWARDLWVCYDCFCDELIDHSHKNNPDPHAKGCGGKCKKGGCSC